MKRATQLIVAATFIWIGFVGAISFMEAWLKFQAPGITLPLGLGIGDLVFTALNRVEWVLTLTILGSLYASRPIQWKKELFWLIPMAILIVQTIYFLPVLSARAHMIIAGETPPPSYAHIGFIVAEAIKMTSLFLYGRQKLRG